MPSTASPHRSPTRWNRWNGQAEVGWFSGSRVAGSVNGGIRVEKEVFWPSAGLKRGHRCGGGSRGLFRGYVWSPAEVPVGVFELCINGWGEREPGYAGGARVGPR